MNSTLDNWPNTTMVVRTGEHLADTMKNCKGHGKADLVAVPTQTMCIGEVSLTVLGVSAAGKTFTDPDIDDLPEIRDNIKKGFWETQKTVNSWISTFKKRLDGEEDEDFDQHPARPAQNYVRRSGEYGRRSADYARYDADPQVIGDDFSKLEVKDGDHPPRTSSRPMANPNLFKSTGEGRKSSPASGRKVSFQEGPPEEIHDMYSASPKPTTTVQPPQTTGKTSKWQPLSAVEPSPVGENDPFSLGDSDDEKDAKPITMKDEESDKLDVGAEAATKETTAKKEDKPVSAE